MYLPTISSLSLIFQCKTSFREKVPLEHILFFFSFKNSEKT